MKSLLVSRKFQSIIGFAVSGAILVWLLAKMDWVKVLHELKSVNYWPFLPAALVILAQYGLRSLRWRYLLPDGEKIRMPLLIDAVMIGGLANLVLPLRAGEFVRPYILKRQINYSFSTAFSSIVIERFFDLSLVLISFAVMILFVPGVPGIVYSGAYAFGTMAVCLLVFMVIGSVFPDFVSRIAHACFKPLPSGARQKLGRFIDDLLAGTKVLHEPRKISMVVFLSICIWFVIYISYQIMLELFGLTGSLWIGTAVGVFTALAVAAPSAPGFIGVYQAGCIAALVLFGVDREVATAFSLITHLFQFLISVLLGSVCLLRNNLHFADLRKPVAEDEA